MSLVSYQLKGDIGVITINNPPVNALSQALREGLMNAVITAQQDTSQALVIICAGRTFIAGADITEFGKAPVAPSLPDVFCIIEGSTKPVVAALHGTALGGGFETALACHYRCALNSAKVGFPEVKLGLLPGAGGTQRVPRLAGVEAALNLITTGNPMSSSNAEALGLIDKIIKGDLLTGAVEYAQTLVDSGTKPIRVGDIKIAPNTIPENTFADFRAKLAKRARGQNAPQHIVTCVEASVSLPFEEGLKKERELFIECRDSAQSAAMRHMFFAEREAAKINGLAKDTPTREIRSVGIIGGGTMGGGIAMSFANAGIPVKLVEINKEALQRGLALVAKNYDITVKKGKLNKTAASERQDLIKGTTDYADLADVDLVIEAAVEHMGIKKQIFTQLDTVCKPGTILATNTSYLDINAISAASNRSQDVIGLHFFSPANVMKLLEIVRADKTSDEVVATSMAIAKLINKVPVLARISYGFIGNRMLKQYAREAQLCMMEGSTPEQIDRVMVDFGMAMGPLSVSDLSGLDISYKARQSLSDADKGEPESYRIADALVEMGRLGQKAGAGYYSYDANTRARSSDPEVLKVIEAESAKLGIVRRALSNEEILNRLTFALINEGMKILEEGIAQRPSDIDVVYVFGYGFPVHRGGPMFYAETVGLTKVYDTICAYRERHGEQYWQPAALLKKLVDEGKTLAEWAAEQA